MSGDWMDEKDNKILEEYNKILGLFEQGEDIGMDVLDLLASNEGLYKERGVESLATEAFDKAWAYILRDEDANGILMGLLSSFIAEYVNAIGGINSIVQ